MVETLTLRPQAGVYELAPLGLEEPYPGKEYGVEGAKKAAHVLSVRPTPSTKQLAGIVCYEDGTYEIVPTAVIADHAPKVPLAALWRGALCLHLPQWAGHGSFFSKKFSNLAPGLVFAEPSTRSHH